MTVNKHLEHLEDLVLRDETWKALGLLDSLIKYLVGRPSTISITVKYDGAPAIFAGIDPSDGKFFVAKKGIFNKSGAKIYKTEADIDADATGDLAHKLKLALAQLPRLGIKGVIQGDFLFSKEDIQEVDLDGTTYLTFHPNTLVYAIPKDSENGQRILKSEFGVVWHTRYRGQSFETMSASFGEKIASELNQDEAIWSIDASSETRKIGTDPLLSRLYKLTARVARNRHIDELGFIHNPKLIERLNVYVNSLIRSGIPMSPSRELILDIRSAVERFYDEETAKRKTDVGINSAITRKTEALGIFDRIPIDDMVEIFEIYKEFTELKKALLDDLSGRADILVFLKTSDGLVRTSHEGYVVSGEKITAKLVDRTQFSRANFGAAEKGWKSV